MFAIEVFEPSHATPSEWAALHSYRRARQEEDTPGEPIIPDADFETDLRREWPLWQSRRLIAVRDGGILGNCGQSYRRPGSENFASHAPYINLWGGVLTPHRRRGIATALLRAALPFIDAMGKTTISLSTETAAGGAFLAAIGAQEKHRSVENRLDLASLDWAGIDHWDRAIPADLTWEIHVGRAPLARLETLYPQFTALLQTIPLGDLDIPPIRYEIAGTRIWYGELDRHGGAHHLALLMRGETVMGICEASHDARFPDRVFQALTAVAPEARGQGLAKALKARMLHLIRREHPGARWMITNNANVNAPMLSIKRRLGFRLHRQASNFQINRDTLAGYFDKLAERP